MPDNAIQATDLGGVVRDFTIWGLFTNADLIVQAVMVLLLVASFWCWAIIFDKVMRFKRIRTQADAFEEVFWSGHSLEELYNRIKDRPNHPMAMLFISAMREWRRSFERRGAISGPSPGLQDRIQRVMRVTLNREMEGLERYLGFLATVSSAAPFVGLFGTVWGIMHSFTSIAASHDTSLAVVAPGIAESLFATAMGLIAAVPALIAYNKFANDMASYANRLEGFADEFLAILSRQLDEGSHH